VDEFELIRRYFVRDENAPDVICGIGDDGAVVQTSAATELVIVIDTLIEGVHFPAGTNASDIGYRAVAVNLSDIAAMGARPRWMTLALTIASAEAAWIQSFADGLHTAAAEHDVQLVGGDMTRGDRCSVTVQINGEVDTGCAIQRAGARSGDTIFVTGCMGDAAAGLERLSQGHHDDYLAGRFLRPAARVAYGQALVGTASAAIDLSDGLYADLKKMLTASGVGAEIDLHSLPISTALQANFNREEQRRFALSGGDDYELCFTATHDGLPDAGDVRVTAIGRVTDSQQVVCLDEGVVVPFDDSGYRHFQ
jgi:thiamine-monophosphate kinase